MVMTWVDWIIVAVLVISTAMSWLKGFISELISLVTWCASIAVVFYFAPTLADVLANSVELNYVMRLWLARIALFASTLIVGSIIKQLVMQLVRATGLSQTDRVLGMVFGLGRGVLLLLLVTTLLRWAGGSPETTPWWQHSVLIPYVQIIEKHTLASLEGVSSQSMTLPIRKP